MQTHIHLESPQLEGATFAILAGDPERVKTLATHLDDKAKHLASNREFTSYLIHMDNRPVLILSTGIGGPSTSIAIEEATQLGIRQFLRLGTCGAIQPHIAIGDMIISSASVRLDATSEHFAPLAYPAVASFQLTEAVVNATRAQGTPHHVGITASSATFYPGQERYDTHSGYIIQSLQNSKAQWQQLNVLNYEMESATLFTMAATMGLEAACICAVVATRYKETEQLNLQGLKDSEAQLGNIAKSAIRQFFS